MSLAILDKIKKYYLSKGDFIGRQRFILFLGAVVLTILVASAQASGILDGNDKILRTLSILVIFLSVVLLFFYFRGKVKVSKAMMMFGIGVQLLQSARIIYISLFLEGKSNLIVLNCILTLMLLDVLLMCYVRIAPAVMTGIYIIAIIVVFFDKHTTEMAEMLIILGVFALFTVYLGVLTNKNFHIITEQNALYKQNESALMSVVRMNRKEIYSFIDICSKSSPTEDDLKQFFDLLSDNAERNISKAVEWRKARLHAGKDSLMAIFPKFTKTEIEVCRLIIQGKKLSEICSLTYKSENNVNAVRSHMRKKLGLNPTDDLRDSLIKRIKEAQRED